MKNIPLIIWMILLSRFVLGQSGTREVVICNGTTVRLKAESTGASSFEWHRNGEPIPGFSGNELVVSQEGIYAAFALNADGCPSDESVRIILGFRHPVAVGDFTSGHADSELVLDVLQNDQPSCTPLDSATLAIRVPPQHGKIVRRKGLFRYMPDKDFKEHDSFTYSVKDQSGLESNPATVSLEIMSLPLPVTLITFTAEREESVTKINWTTTLEVNSESFEIQRSQDGKQWITIGDVPAHHNTSEANAYQFTDEQPVSGVNYYRLKMIDSDRGYAYSAIRAVHFPEFSWAYLYPNPVSNKLNIRIINKEVRKLRLIDLTGRTLYSTLVTGNKLELDMKSHPSGVYFIHLEQLNGLIAIFKIVHN